MNEPTYYCHIAYDSRSITGQVINDARMMVGTPDQIAERVANTVKHGLARGSKTIVLNPVHPASIINLEKR